MATWTAIQIRNGVLEHLNIKAKGASANAEDAQKVDDLYNSAYPKLAKKGLTPWLQGAVDEEAQEPLIAYLAGFAAPKFGFSGGRLAEIKALAREALKDLYEQSSTTDQGPTKATYY
jgi:hypothetical protein